MMGTSENKKKSFALREHVTASIEKRKAYKEREAYHRSVLKEAKKDRKSVLEAPNGSYIVLQNINKIYDNHVQAVFDFNLDIGKNEFIVFVGPSGCGKSTTLRMIAGLEDITSGRLFIDGEYANDLLPKDRQIAMVFQSYALYPHMSVYKNMAFSLKYHKKAETLTDPDGKVRTVYRRYRKEEIRQRVLDAAEVLELTEFLDRKPRALSGGQCQRVALGRAIVRKPKVFLMDEPLSNLDAKLRVSMRSEIVALHKRVGATTIYVTHDQTEAMTMADRIVVMSKGYIQQVGTPLEIYNEPANVFVATFIGSPSMNIVEASVKEQAIEVQGKRVVTLTGTPYESVLDAEKILFGIRPENIEIVAGRQGLPVRVDAVELLGNEFLFKFTLFGEKWIGKSPIKERLIRSGDSIRVRFDGKRIHLFDSETKMRR